MSRLVTRLLKAARWLAAALAIVVVMLLLSVLLLPASLWLNAVPLTAQMATAQPQALVAIAGSRLYKGKAMVDAQPVPTLLTWAWCPSEGLLAICAALSSGGVADNSNASYAEAVLLPRISGLAVAELRFSGLPLHRLALTGMVDHVTLGGTLQSLKGSLQSLNDNSDKPSVTKSNVLRWGQTCYGQLLAGMHGDLYLSIANSETVNVALAPTHNQLGFRLKGDQLNGRFQLKNNRLLGQLLINAALVPAVAQGFLQKTPQGYQVDVNTALPCW